MCGLNRSGNNNRNPPATNFYELFLPSTLLSISRWFWKNFYMALSGIKKKRKNTTFPMSCLPASLSHISHSIFISFLPSPPPHFIVILIFFFSFYNTCAFHLCYFILTLFSVLFSSKLLLHYQETSVLKMLSFCLRVFFLL